MHNHDNLHCHGDHNHAHTYDIGNNRLSLYVKAWSITWLIAIIELIGSYFSGSVSLLADVTHVVTDTIIGLAPVSVEVIRKKKPFWSPQNIERLGGIIASIFLITVGISIIKETLHLETGGHEHHVNGIFMLFFSIIAALFNFWQHKILSKVSPIHRHSAHAGFHFHILTDLAKNIALPIVAILLSLGVNDSLDITIAHIIGYIIILRSLILLAESVYGHNFVQDKLRKVFGYIFS